MNNELIKRVFLAHGFKEKDQGDGRMDLNPYVYEAARALLMSAPIGDLFACNTCRCPIYTPVPFQARVKPWMDACFGERISADKQERNHRFLEEALELVQACGATAEEARQLVDYVYGRPVGEPKQEVGGVMVTLAALCLAQTMDMHSAAEAELTRIWGKVEQIRAKQAAKPAIGPLPGCYPDRTNATKELPPDGPSLCGGCLNYTRDPEHWDENGKCRAKQSR